MAELQLISSDSHVSEPPDLWVERIDTKYRDRAPRVVLNPEGQEGAYLVYEGYPPHNLAIGLGAGRTPEELAAFLKTGTYADARPGGWDPAQRLPDMELDGVEAEVLYTTLGFRLFWLKDAGLQRACFRVYNDWLAAYCSYAPKRLKGLALISLYDPRPQGGHDLVLPACRPALQLGDLRSVLGGGAGPGHARQPPRHHRHGAYSVGIQCRKTRHALNGYPPRN